MKPIPVIIVFPELIDSNIFFIRDYIYIDIQWYDRNIISPEIMIAPAAEARIEIQNNTYIYTYILMIAPSGA